MKSIFSKIFKKSRTALPKSWLGYWIDKNGKLLEIKEPEQNSYLISVKDKNGQYYSIRLLEEKEKATTDLVGRFSLDNSKNPFLQVEAGVKGLGPTYNLYFFTIKENGEYRLARDTDKLEKIRIRPNVGLGLYDDWEDDLGVPWAYPLKEFKKKN